MIFAEHITSPNNAQIKQAVLLQQKSKERRKTGLFTAEGPRMVRETPLNLLKQLFLTESFYQKLDRERDADLFLRIDQTDSYLVSDEVMKKMSDTETPQGIVAVIQMPSYELTELAFGERSSTFLILEDIQDPGNLGTIFRTAEGAGVSGVIMSKGCVDLFNPKTIRSTMGAIYRVPFVISEDLSEVMKLLAKEKIPTYAAHLKGEKYYDEFDYTRGAAFLIGNEGNGLSAELASLADCYLKIPMEGELESLNAAVSAAILMYEAYRQRRH